MGFFSLTGMPFGPLPPYLEAALTSATQPGALPAPPSSHWSILVRTGGAEGAPPAVHAWEHRRAEAGAGAEAELAFTAQLLARDFSNFSAWHHRGRLLAEGPLPPERLREGAWRPFWGEKCPIWGLGPKIGWFRPKTELELVQNAVFTDPQDQSAWVYLRCLLARGRGGAKRGRGHLWATPVDHALFGSAPLFV